MLLKSFAKTYIRYIRIQLKPATVRLYESALRNVLLPRFGEMELMAVTKQHVFEMCLQLESTPTMANRCVAVGSAMYGRAAQLDCVPKAFNPFSRGKIYRETRRERVLSAEEYQRLACALDHFERYQLASIYAIAGIRVLLLTGARLSEVETLRWDEVNFNDRCITLRDSKTGPRTLEMPACVVRLLENLPAHPGPSVFPSRYGRQIRLNLVWRKVRIMADVEDVRLHDLRHTYATWAVHTGVAIPTIARLLGHSTEWMTARYLHADRVQSAAAAEKIATVIDQEMRPR